MFSHSKRCVYRNNQLNEVICQLRFPEILTIGANVPVDFQEAIRQEFPKYFNRLELHPPKFDGPMTKLTAQPQPPTHNYQFSSADDGWRINLTSKFISLTTSNYVCWEEFAQKLDKPLAAFIKIYQPAYFERIGLRYLNFFSRKSLSLEGVPYREMFQSCYLGPLGEADVDENRMARTGVDFDIAINGGCRAQVHAGPGHVKRNSHQDPELKFILDLDLYMAGKVPVNYSAGALQTLHSQAYPIFRGAITNSLHNAMEPETI